MSQNLDQIFIANPITTNASTDLMYFMQSPYSSGTDAAMTFANFSAQFGAPFTPAALTKMNDTNVTLTLGGTPATALLQATSLTLGWTGTLSGTRGGTGVNNGASTFTIGGNTAFSGAFTFTGTLTGNTNVTFPTSGTLATTSQLVTAAQIQNQAFTSDINGGSANALTITLSPAPAAYVEGQLFTVRAAANNTTTTTLNVNGLGAKGVFTAGGNACVGGEIVGGSSYLFEYNGALNAFIIINPSNLITNQAPQIQNQRFVYAVDSGAANAYVVTLGTVPGAYIDGMLVSFRAVNANSGASTINVNSLGVKSIVTNANAALSGGEILANGSYDLIYNSSFGKFVLINSSASGGGITAAQIQNQAFTYAVDTGVADNYIVSYSPSAISVHDGQALWFSTANANTTGAPNISINGSAPRPITAIDGIYPGSIGVNSSNLIIYSSAQGAFILVNPDILATVTGSFATINGVLQQKYVYDLDTGSANAYQLSDIHAGSLPSDGAKVATTALNSNTGPSTLNLAGLLAPLPIIYNNGDPLVGGEIIAGGYYEFSYRSSGNFFVILNPSAQSSSLQTPLTGFSITIDPGIDSLILDPSGTLATGTITMPASPNNDQRINISSSQIITSLTVSANAGQTISNTPATIAAGAGFAYIYNSNLSNWYRLY